MSFIQLSALIRK